MVENPTVRARPDRKSGQIRDDAGVHAKFGVAPPYIPDYLALVGDAADGYPGIPVTASVLICTVVGRVGQLCVVKLVDQNGPLRG